MLHVYTLDRGRVGAVAKGIRKTKSRFGARLEPLSHVELMLHAGGGELQTVTGVQLVRSHHAAREEQYRLAVGLQGAEAMLRLFTEQEANGRAFQALTRFLDLLDDAASRWPRGPRSIRSRSRSSSSCSGSPATCRISRAARTAARRRCSSSATRRKRAARSAGPATPVRCRCHRPGSPASRRCSRVRSQKRVTPAWRSAPPATRSR